MNRQTLFLIGLLGILVLSVVYAWQSMPRQQIATARSAAKAAKAVPTEASPEPTGRQAQSTTRNSNVSQTLNLEAPVQKPVVIKRDLFRPLDGGEQAMRGKGSKAVVPAPPPPPPPPPPTKSEIARREFGQYKIMGFLKRDGKQVVFVSKGEKIMLIREGDSLIAGYAVTSIGDYRLVMRAADGDEIMYGGR